MRWTWGRKPHDQSALLRFVRSIPGEMAEMDIATALKKQTEAPGWNVLKHAFMNQFLKSMDVMGDDKRNVDVRSGMMKAYAAIVRVMDSTEAIDLAQLARDLERDAEQRKDEEER